MDALPLAEFERRHAENYARPAGPPATPANDAPRVLGEALRGAMPIVAPSGHQIGSMSWPLSAALVRVGDVLLPERIDAELTGADGEPDVRLTVEFRGGAPGYTRVEMISKPSGRHILSKDVSIVRDRMNYWLHEAILNSAAQRPGSTVHAPDWADGAATRTSVRDARPTVRRKITDALLRDVADIYRNHIAGKPVVAVQLAYGVPHRTASRYAQLARAAGYLPPTTRGKKSVVTVDTTVGALAADTSARGGDE